MRRDVLKRDFASVQVRDLADDRKSESSASCLRRARRVYPVEPLEDPLRVLRRNPSSMVLDDKARTIHPDDDLGRAGMADRVLDEI